MFDFDPRGHDSRPDEWSHKEHGREHLPHVTVGTGTSARVRLFPDQLPIGVETTGRVVFLYLVTSSVVDDLCAFAQRHVELLCALPGWTLRLLFQPHASRFTASAALVARDELTMRLAPATIAELRWYFEQCLLRCFGRETRSLRSRRRPGCNHHDPHITTGLQSPPDDVDSPLRHRPPPCARTGVS